MEKIDIEGYKKILDATLDESREMLKLLCAKTAILSAKTSSQGSMYPLNESVIDSKISLIKINGEIKVLERIINDKEKYFKQWFPQFEKDAAICNRDWDFVFNCAKTESSKNEMLKKIISTMDMEKVAAEPELRLGYFDTFQKQLKGKV